MQQRDRFWAGMSSDLIIEQVLMRSAKILGDLTQGKVMSETQCLIWVLSMPACANINEAIQKFSCSLFETSDQHKDLSTARQARDCNDTII